MATRERDLPSAGERGGSRFGRARRPNCRSNVVRDVLEGARTHVAQRARLPDWGWTRSSCTPVACSPIRCPRGQGRGAAGGKLLCLEAGRLAATRRGVRVTERPPPPPPSYTSNHGGATQATTVVAARVLCTARTTRGGCARVRRGTEGLRFPPSPCRGAAVMQAVNPCPCRGTGARPRGGSSAASSLDDTLGNRRSRSRFSRALRHFFL